MHSLYTETPNLLLVWSVSLLYLMLRTNSICSNKDIVGILLSTIVYSIFIIVGELHIGTVVYISMFTTIILKRIHYLSKTRRSDTV